MMVNFSRNDLLVGIGILCMLLPVLWWYKRSVSYLFFFSVFWAYLLAVVAVIVFPIVIDPDYTNIEFTPDINFIPFYFDECFKHEEICIRNIVGNIVITIPFGFGINFLIKIKPKRIFGIACAVGLMFEILQLAISLVFRSGFRAIDVNDVILNGTGVLMGYALFRLFAWLYLRIMEHSDFKHKIILADIYEVAIQTQVADRARKHLTPRKP